MDPASAIGIASAALTFLEFTYKFGNALFSIATDAGPADFEGVEETCRKMREMASKIVTSQNASGVLSPPQLAVVSLSNQCRLIADRILRKLEQTKPATRKFVPQIKAAVKYVYSRDELMVLQRNLDTCRAQLQLHLSFLHAWVFLPYLFFNTFCSAPAMHLQKLK
jgi:hypothetical protein